MTKLIYHLVGQKYNTYNEGFFIPRPKKLKFSSQRIYLIPIRVLPLI